MSTTTILKTSTRWLKFTAIAALLTGSVAGCSSSGAAPPSTDTTSAKTSTSPSSTAQDATVFGNVFGIGVYPTYTVKAPVGWTSNGHFITTTGPGAPGLSVWDVGKVPRDPCRWKQQLRDPGPTTTDLIDALKAQKYRNATAPTTATLAGYTGKYLETSVPSDWVVTGNADFKGCDDPGNGHTDFVNWLSNGDQAESYQQVAGQVDRLWILHVNGQRLVVDASYRPDTTAAARTELGQIVQTLKFAKPTG